MNQDKFYWLAFSAFGQIGPKRFALLKDYFGSAQKAWEANQNQLLSTGLSSNLVQDLVNFRQKFSCQNFKKQLEDKKIKVSFLDEDYPVNLRQIADTPFVLYYQGQLDFSDPNLLAVVGTRKMTAYGHQVAESLVSELALSGITIVSGLARGIDTISHKAALESGGKTIAVLGSGVDVIYPSENSGLSREIIQKNGAIISEFPPGTKPLPHHFPIRNRIISGLSLGTVVIEAQEKSGALITAAYAAQQGREVFAVPGPIYSPTSQGPANLIKYGAKLVFSSQDILEELKIAPLQKSTTISIQAESNEEKIILSLIQYESKHIDQICKESGLEMPVVSSCLTMMEIKGNIKNLGGLIYGIRK